MKKLLSLLCLLSFGLLLTGCVSEDEVVLKDITGITFEDKTVDYTAELQTIVIIGTLPSGTSVSYTGNSGTEAGEYDATAVIVGDGYNSLTLTATLTITEVVLKEITGFTFEDKTVTYDGEKHSLLLSKSVDDFNVVYEKNEGVNAGVYNATVKITKTGYYPLTLTAVLTINKAVITGVQFETLEVDYDGEEHVVELKGTLPEGTSAFYQNNRGTENGVYNAKVTITGANYETLVLETTLTIKKGIVDLADFAFETLKNIVALPDAWAFLPESFKLENKENLDQLDYTNFNNVSSIGTGGIGMQMNVVYDTLLQTDTLLSYVAPINTALNTVTTLYQDFINKNPEDYSEFEYTGNQVPFSFKIILDDNIVTLLASLSSASVELTIDTDENMNTARIQLTDSNALKYEYSDGYLRLGVNVLNTFVSELAFTTDDKGITSGVLYEFTDIKVGQTVLKTTSYITITEFLTTIICNKRESNDLIVNAKVEVYNNETGNMVGNFVEETVKVINYYTMWFNLEDINGFNSIKAIDGETNGSNLDSFFVNNNASKFSAATNITSRKYDIEYVTKYSYDYNSQTEKYEKNTVIVPMMFIQRGNVDSFVNDVTSKNSYLTGVGFKTNAPDILGVFYDELIKNFNGLKELNTMDETISFIGVNNEFFK